MQKIGSIWRERRAGCLGPECLRARPASCSDGDVLEIAFLLRTSPPMNPKNLPMSTRFLEPPMWTKCFRYCLIPVHLSPNCNSANIKLWKIFDDNSHPQSKSHFYEVADYHKDKIIDFTCNVPPRSWKFCQLLRKLLSQEFDFGICNGEAPFTGLYKAYPYTRKGFFIISGLAL